MCFNRWYVRRYKGHKINNHATLSSSPMYEALARISEGSAERTVSLSLRPCLLSGRNYAESKTALKSSRVVYEIPCSYGQKYIEETKRTLEMHLKEHEAAMRRGETEKSAVAEHAWLKHPHPLLEETRILDRKNNTTNLLMKEAMCISLRDPKKLLNRDHDLDINCCWKNSTKKQQNLSRTREQSVRRLGPSDIIC